MDSDDEWLAELLTSHRPIAPTAHPPQPPETTDQETTDSLLVLVTAHRPEAGASAPSRAAIAVLGGLTPCASVSSGASAASTLSSVLPVANASSGASAPTAAVAPVAAAVAPVIAVPGGLTPRPEFESWGEVDDYLSRSPLQQRALYQTWTVPEQDDILTAACLSITCPPPGHVGPWVPLGHVVCRLRMWGGLLGPLAFKIGIAADPQERFWNASHGYVREGTCHFMDVLLDGPANLCRAMEIALIHALRGVAGCQNQSPGGEGVHPCRSHRCFVYITLAGAGAGVGLAAAVAERRRHRRERQ